MVIFDDPLWPRVSQLPAEVRKQLMESSAIAFIGTYMILLIVAKPFQKIFGSAIVNFPSLHLLLTAVISTYFALRANTVGRCSSSTTREDWKDLLNRTLKVGFFPSCAYYFMGTGIIHIIGFPSLNNNQDVGFMAMATSLVTSINAYYLGYLQSYQNNKPKEE